LKEIAKPDRDLSAGNPKERRDSIVYCRRHGMIVVEVKDWAIDQIRKANPLSFTLRISGKYEKRDNPFRQCIWRACVIKVD
jgi:hypothetical protein